jgi:folate-binding protein YgfZ
MLSNDVTTAPCRALLLTPKARVIAPVVVVRRAEDDFLLLTEPGLAGPVTSTLLRARFAAKAEIAPEEHSSVVVFGEDGGIPNAEFGEPASELLDADVEATLSGEELEQMRIDARMPAWGKEIDDSILPAEAGLDETHVSFTKGCYPGQEPIARLKHRGKVNRTLRLLEVESASPGDEIHHGEKVVGRVTSFASSAQATPRNLVSKRLQRVTQWMSIVISVLGSALSSSQLNVTGSSTSPKTLKSQVERSVSGIEPA